MPDLQHPYTGIIQFQLQDLLNLLVHYTDGQIPPTVKPINFGPSAVLNGWYAIDVEFDKEWPDAKLIPGLNAYEPFHFRFEGDKILVMNRKTEDPVITNFDPASDIKRR